MKRLHNLRARSKFLIAYGLFVLPIAFLFYVFINKTMDDVGFAQKERRGTEYVAALRQVQAADQQPRQQRTADRTDAAAGRNQPE